VFPKRKASRDADSGAVHFNPRVLSVSFSGGQSRQINRTTSRQVAERWAELSTLRESFKEKCAAGNGEAGCPDSFIGLSPSLDQASSDSACPGESPREAGISCRTEADAVNDQIPATGFMMILAGFVALCVRTVPRLMGHRADL